MKSGEIFLPGVLRKAGLPVNNEIAEAVLAFEGIDPTIQAADLLTQAQEAQGRFMKARKEFLAETMADRVLIELAVQALRGDYHTAIQPQVSLAEITSLQATPDITFGNLAQTLLSEIITTPDFVEYLTERRKRGQP